MRGCVDAFDCPNPMPRCQTSVWPRSAVPCPSESSRCLPPLLLARVSLTRRVQSKWSAEGSLNPDKCYKSPPAAALLRRPLTGHAPAPVLAT